MYKLIIGPWVYTLYINILLGLIILVAFLYNRKLLGILISLSIFFGFLLFILGVRLNPIILGWLASLFIPLILIKIRKTFDSYREMLTKEYSVFEKEYNELVAQEGMIYDTQLKHNKRLTEISSLYEITKEMSTSLRFSDIFKILAEHLQKIFLFAKAKLILIKIDTETTSGSIVYETAGIKDVTLKAKGIFPKIEITSPQLDEHDKKICELLKKDIRNLQIIKTEWKENPYIQLLPKDAQTYIANPIVVESQLIGVLAIEDLAPSDFEKFLILATQFTLEAKRITLYEKVEEMAITDGLTKAFAKRHIMERLTEEFERSVRHNFNLSFLMVDIDYFKKCNDTYGHLVGDVVLRDIVALLKGNTREIDLVGRFGGEEFCVILTETKKDEARLVAERLREIIQNHKIKAYDELISVRASIGVATYPDDAKNIDELIENSDQALYMAKNKGRNKVCVHSS